MATPRFTPKTIAANIKRFQQATTDRLVAENVTQASNGSFRCAIAGAGTCPFGLPKMLQFTFACHFMRQHPKEAAEKGFLEQPGTLTGKTPGKTQPASLGMFVVKTEQGYSCRIDPDQRCDYLQEDQVSAPDFVRHFRQAHTALAMKHGFYKAPESAENRSLLRSNIKSFMAKATMKGSEPPAKRKLDTEESSVDLTDENVWKYAPSDQPSKYCRLCFSVAQPSKQIFSSPEDTASSCAALIAECTGVQLSAREDHPAAICHECSEKLHDIKCFRLLCETLNRVVCRNRATIQPGEPSAAPVNSSPPPLVSIAEPAAVNLFIEHHEGKTQAETSLPIPPLVPFDETVIATSVVDNLPIENGDQDQDVVELSDSEEEIESDPAEVEFVEESDDDEEPYIPLQDDWFCCKLCNQIHQTLDVMIDHLNNYHSEIGFFAKPDAAAKLPINQSRKKRRRTKETPIVDDYQQVILNSKTYYKCNHCDTLVTQKGNMARHYRIYHQGNNSGPRFFCSIAGCNQGFMDRMGLNRHQKLQHETCDELMALGRQSSFEL